MRAELREREDLLREYGLVERDGVVSWMIDERTRVTEMFALRPECERLLLDCLREVGDGLVAYSRSGVRDDDDTDYLSALADQANVLADMLTCSSLTQDASVTEDRVLKILNATYEETIDPNASEDMQAFMLGYANHYSPMSAMMKEMD